ncbi:hypothetical protein BKA93DRAFT_759395 [Sparassis latifolia]
MIPRGRYSATRSGRCYASLSILAFLQRRRENSYGVNSRYRSMSEIKRRRRVDMRHNQPEAGRKHAPCQYLFQRVKHKTEIKELVNTSSKSSGTDSSR